MDIINKELIAIFGLVIAISILGGAFVHVLWQHTFQFQNNKLLEDELNSLENEKKLLQITIQKLENDLITQKSKNTLIEIPSSQSTIKPIIQPTMIANGLHSGILVEKNLIIKNNGELQKLWNDMVIDVPSPMVNFKQNMIIGVFYGEKPNLCYSISIDKITPFATDEENIDVVVNINKIIGDDDCPKRSTTPYYVIQLPFVPNDVFFTENIVVQ